MKRAHQKVAVVSILVLVGLLSSARAQAQISPGKLRLHLDTKLFSYTHYKSEYDYGEEDTGTARYDVVTLGPGAAQSLYFAQPQFGLGFGGVVFEGLTVGGRLDLGFGTMKEGDDDDDYFSLVLRAVPYVEYAFSVQGPVRPFVVAMVGYEGVYVSNKGGGYESKYKIHGVIAGGGCGVHFFLAPAFSLDLTLLATYKYNKARDEDKDEDSGDWETDTTIKGNYANLDLLLGFSGWF